MIIIYDSKPTWEGVVNIILPESFSPVDSLNLYHIMHMDFQGRQLKSVPYGLSR